MILRPIAECAAIALTARATSKTLQNERSVQWIPAAARKRHNTIRTIIAINMNCLITSRLLKILLVREIHSLSQKIRNEPIYVFWKELA
jgi:hypothetical protein